MKSKFVLVLAAIFVLSSCNKTEKNSYLKDYSEFIKTVEMNYEQYSNKDWDKAKKEFEHYSNEIYDKYEDELSMNEKLTLSKYKIQFNIYRLEKELNYMSNEDYDKLKEKVVDYYKNDMQDDLELLKKESHKASEELQDFLNDIIEEVEEKNKD